MVDLSVEIDQIWRTYGGKLKALLRSKLANPEDVEDLMQEILLKTHQGIGNLNAEEKIQSWLFQIARNAVIDFYRSRGRAESIDDRELWYFDDTTHDQLALSECILPFIEQLPVETADLLKAIDIEGRSQKEYVSELGISYSGLKSRVQRGRVQLRSIFERCCEFELDHQGRVVGYEARSKGCGRC